MSPITQSSLPNKLDVPLRLSALLVLFAGVGLGLFTLSSAAGIWLGAWDYRTGLGILRMANTAGAYLFWCCLALGIGSSLFAMLMAHDDRRRLIAYAGVGIVAAALDERCDMIVVPTHGKGAVRRLILGSTTQNVLDLSPLPVLVLRRGAADRESD